MIAWDRTIRLLQAAFASAGEDAKEWGVLIEMPLLRLGRRIDAVILVRDQIVCIEFKIGSAKFHTADIDQAVDYALCLRDFHEGSRGRLITPVLCADLADVSEAQFCLRYIEHVASCVLTNGQQIANVLVSVAKQAQRTQINWQSFDSSRYNPTPTIVGAARAVYAGHGVEEIGRSDASATDLRNTAQELEGIVVAAKEQKEHAICFVTGAPGSGKTLLGLDLVLSGEAGRVRGEPAVLLSGNRPLVHVLQEAIVKDARDRLGVSAIGVRREAQQALQTLLGYLREYSNPESIPVEHVVVFDEAQRAWDSNTGFKLMGRNKSEPQLFLEIMGRLSWACLVCLVGSGQEINRGEGGLALWGEAVKELRDKWRVYGFKRALGVSVGSFGSLSQAESISAKSGEQLHLKSNIRAHRNPKYGLWVEALMAGELTKAASIARSMEYPPAVITRDLGILKKWLRARKRGGHRAGLLASSGARRLLAEGIPPSPRSNELDAVAHWFLKPDTDFRSSNSLEMPLSEYVCQGLELDYVGLLWGNDLIWVSRRNQDDSCWVPREMRAPNWKIRKKVDAVQYRLNAYRVLLTRARAGTAIFVPHGKESDPTLEPRQFQGIFNALRHSGCEQIE